MLDLLLANGWREVPPGRGGVRRQLRYDDRPGRLDLELRPTAQSPTLLWVWIHDPDGETRVLQLEPGARMGEVAQALVSMQKTLAVGTYIGSAVTPGAVCPVSNVMYDQFGAPSTRTPLGGARGRHLQVLHRRVARPDVPPALERHAAGSRSAERRHRAPPGPRRRAQPAARRLHHRPHAGTQPARAEGPGRLRALGPRRRDLAPQRAPAGPGRRSRDRAGRAPRLRRDGVGRLPRAAGRPAGRRVAPPAGRHRARDAAPCPGTTPSTGCSACRSPLRSPSPRSTAAGTP